MRRREFIAGLGSAAAWPLAARAQQAAMPVIGYLSFGTPREGVDGVAAFLQGLAAAGYVEGRDVAIEFRWANNQGWRLPQLAAELAESQVAVIVALDGGPSALAAKACHLDNSNTLLARRRTGQIRLGRRRQHDRPNRSFQ
jgi:putative ABC transport system substrate-binding protein